MWVGLAKSLGQPLSGDGEENAPKRTRQREEENEEKQ